jgi:hypothetical protein
MMRGAPTPQVFCTSSYFAKKGSFEELYCAVAQQRQILAMLEPDPTQEGGLEKADVEALVTNEQLLKVPLFSPFSVPVAAV